jgi:hypothetical protein
MNERTDAEGNKVLFLEEVQSDWGQRVKKVGVRRPSINYEIVKSKDVENEFDLINKSNGEIAAKGRLEWIKERKADWESKNVEGEIAAPFVTDTNAWVKLGLKYALKQAVESGATKIAWTTGEQQNDRYDLSKQIDRISYYQAGDTGMYQVDADKSGSNIISKKMDLKEIEETFGKDIAEKVKNGEGSGKGDTRFLSGVDLKVGGKGMKGFYDKILPDVFKSATPNLM